MHKVTPTLRKPIGPLWWAHAVMSEGAGGDAVPLLARCGNEGTARLRGSARLPESAKTGRPTSPAPGRGYLRNTVIANLLLASFRP